MSFGIGFFQRDFNPLRPCGRRHLPFATSPPHLNFNPLRPCGRRPVPLPARFAISCYFNPLRPCGRRPLEAANKRLIGAISIHSARVGGDFILRLANETLSNFNPLRPCGRRPESALKGSERAYFNPLRPCGRRLLGFKSQQLPAPFQSTPPVWAETFKDPLGVFNPGISIHSARVGGDRSHFRFF